MKYNTIQDLDSRIENIIKRTVKHYITDWTQYDRPKYNGFKESSERADKEFYLIARTCGTYLVRIEDINAGNEWANAIIDYYRTQNPATYYYINLNKLEVKKIDPKTIKTVA